MIVTVKEIAGRVGLVASTIRRSYIDKPEKRHHLKCLELGTYIANKDITDDELVALIEGFVICKKEIVKNIQRKK